MGGGPSSGTLGRGRGCQGLAHTRCTIHVGGMRAASAAETLAEPQDVERSPRELVGSGAGADVGLRLGEGRPAHFSLPLPRPPVSVCLSCSFCVATSTSSLLSLSLASVSLAPLGLPGSHPACLSLCPAVSFLSLQLPRGSRISRPVSSPLALQIGFPGGLSGVARARGASRGSPTGLRAHGVRRASFPSPCPRCVADLAGWRPQC